MSRILIGAPVRTDDNGRAIFTYHIITENNDGTKKEADLWYSLEKKYSQFFCDEICDGLVVSFLPYALCLQYDIVSEVPVSERLLYQLRYQVIPQLALMNSISEISISADTVTPNWHPTGVGTAMSCGIDSLTTFFEYTSEQVSKGYRLTHLTFFEQGAHHGGGGTEWSEKHRIFSAQLDTVKRFCDEIGMELIDVQSNVDAVYDLFFPHKSYDQSHTYRNAGFALLLQKLFKVYYYAAAYNLDQFSCSLFADTAHYDKWLLPNVSTENLTLYNSNSSMTRLEKIRFLSAHPETYKHVLVCYNEGYNCGKCIKCWRTMLEMEVQGVLDLYQDSFDINGFRKKYEVYLKKMLQMRKQSPVMEDIYQYMVRHGVEIPQKCIDEVRRENQKKRIRRSLGRIKRILTKSNA